MVYDVSAFIAERDRLIAELQWYQQQPETINKRNEMNNRMTRINQLESMIQQNMMRQQYGQPQYGQSQYGNYMYNNIQNSPYASQNQLPPMASPYQEGYRSQQSIGYSPYGNGQPAATTTNSRYANKPLPQESNSYRVSNEPPSSYRVESKPIVTKPVVKEVVKKYLSNSIYPLLTYKNVKEIERTLETGYVEREAEILKDSSPLPFIEYEKSKEIITSREEFYKTFINHLPYDIYVAYAYNKGKVFAVPEINDDCFTDDKAALKELNENNIFENLKTLMLQSLKQLYGPICNKYTYMFNDILKYCYNNTNVCDNFIADLENLNKHIESIGVIKDRQPYYDALKHIAHELSKIKLEKMGEHKFYKVTLIEPTLTLICPHVHGIMLDITTPVTLRKTSCEELFKIVDDTFKFFGGPIKCLSITIVDLRDIRLECVAYSFGTGADKQYIIVRK